MLHGDLYGEYEYVILEITCSLTVSELLCQFHHLTLRAGVFARKRVTRADAALPDTSRQTHSVIGLSSYMCIWLIEIYVCICIYIYIRILLVDPAFKTPDAADKSL